MALIRLDHAPQSVKVNIPLNIILPEPGQMAGIPVRNRKVLYLLHGLSDDASAPCPPGFCTLWVASNITGKPRPLITGNERKSTESSW